MSSAILIVGAGYVGSEVARRARDYGFGQVVAGSRRPPSLLGVEALAIDVLSPASLTRLPKVDVVVYAIAPADSSALAYERAYQVGLQETLRATAREDGSGPLVILVSSTSVYAEEHGGRVDEGAMDLASSPQGHGIVVGEELLRQSGRAYVILRLGGIYGPGRTYFLRRVQTGAEHLFAGPALFSNRIHLVDAARAVLHVATTTAAHNQTFNVVDDAPADRNEVVAWFHQRLGLTSPLPTTSDRSQIPARGNKRCANDRLKSTGFRFTYPTYQDGYGELIATLSSS